MSAKTSGRIVGALFLIAFLLYGGGSALADSVTGATVVLGEVVGSQDRLTAGALLMLLNSVAVVGLGVVAYPVLQRHHPLTASAYLLTRGFEAAMLAVGAVLLLTLVPLADEFASTQDESLDSLARVVQQGSMDAYWVAMIGLSLGSLLFCRALLRARLLPGPIAIWGFGGYALLATGGVLELFGHGVGVPLAIPGGLFEATAGVLLLARGFPEVQGHDTASGSASMPYARSASPVPVASSGATGRR
jgi:hypothetical protein